MKQIQESPYDWAKREIEPYAICLGAMLLVGASVSTCDEIIEINEKRSHQERFYDSFMVQNIETVINYDKQYETV